MGVVRRPGDDKPMKGRLIVPGNTRVGSLKKVTHGRDVLSLGLTKSIRKYLPWRKYKL